MANETVICTYPVRADSEPELIGLLARRHWSSLRALELVTDEPAQLFRSLEEPRTYVEVFSWVEGGFDRAHEHPDVLAIWEAMDPLLEERDGRPRWDFPHYQRLSLPA